MKANMTIRSRAVLALAAVAALFKPSTEKPIIKDASTSGQWTGMPSPTRFRDGSKKRENKNANRKKAKAARAARKAQR